jgi:hypothetical protein
LVYSVFRVMRWAGDGDAVFVSMRILGRYRGHGYATQTNETKRINCINRSKMVMQKFPDLVLRYGSSQGSMHGYQGN